MLYVTKYDPYTATMRQIAYSVFIFFCKGWHSRTPLYAVTQKEGGGASNKTPAPGVMDLRYATGATRASTQISDALINSFKFELHRRSFVCRDIYTIVPALTFWRDMLLKHSFGLIFVASILVLKPACVSGRIERARQSMLNRTHTDHLWSGIHCRSITCSGGMSTRRAARFLTV